MSKKIVLILLVMGCVGIMMYSYARPRYVEEYFGQPTENIEYIEIRNVADIEITDRDSINEIVSMLGKIQVVPDRHSDAAKSSNAAIYINYQDKSWVKVALAISKNVDWTSDKSDLWQIGIGDNYYEFADEKPGKEAYRALLEYIYRKFQDY
ncbi:MAG: hypothetical protein ACI4EV_02740 [Lachnospiraceae bacterium]